MTNLAGALDIASYMSTVLVVAELCHEQLARESKLGMDVAASEFWKKHEGVYDLDFKNPDSQPESKPLPVMCMSP